MVKTVKRRSDAYSPGILLAELDKRNAVSASESGSITNSKEIKALLKCCSFSWCLNSWNSTTFDPAV